MNSYDKVRDDIIEMQRWAAGSNPQRHSELLMLLLRVRNELERLSTGVDRRVAKNAP